MSGARGPTGSEIAGARVQELLRVSSPVKIELISHLLRRAAIDVAPFQLALDEEAAQPAVRRPETLLVRITAIPIMGCSS